MVVESARATLNLDITFALDPGREIHTRGIDCIYALDTLWEITMKSTFHTLELGIVPGIGANQK